MTGHKWARDRVLRMARSLPGNDNMQQQFQMSNILLVVVADGPLQGNIHPYLTYCRYDLLMNIAVKNQMEKQQQQTTKRNKKQPYTTNHQLPI